MPSTTASPHTAAQRGGLHRRTAIVMTIGFFVLQLAWLFAVPPVGGMDEFDHIYRATSVASGEWYAPPADATRGTGAELRVSRDIIEATKDECLELDYVDSSECLGRDAGDEVVVPSGAGRYNPLYYAVVGAPSLVLDGVAAVYGMRVVALVLCTLLVWLCVTGIRRAGGDRWYAFGLLLGITPTVAYSSIVIAPNALEILAGALLWISLLDLVHKASAGADGSLLVRTALAGSLLVVLRTLGPAWCLMILVCVLATTTNPLQRLRTLLSVRRTAAAAAVVCLATIAGAAWTLAVSSWEIGQPEAQPPGSRLVTEISLGLVVWPLQAVAAFPYRNQPAHPLTYACFLLVFVAVVVGALHSGTRRQRGVIAAIAILFLAVPTVITFATYDLFAAAWQGRYMLPFSIGIVLVAGAALSSRRPPRWLARDSTLFVLGLAYVVAHAAGPTWVLVTERRVSPSVDSGAWLLLPAPVVALMAAGGAIAMWFSVSRDSSALGPSVTPGDRQALQHGGMASPDDLAPSGRRGIGQ